VITYTCDMCDKTFVLRDYQYKNDYPDSWQMSGQKIGSRLQCNDCLAAMKHIAESEAAIKHQAIYTDRRDSQARQRAWCNRVLHYAADDLNNHFRVVALKEKK